jgi:hypothetical protein
MVRDAGPIQHAVSAEVGGQAGDHIPDGAGDGGEAELNTGSQQVAVDRLSMAGIAPYD